MGIWNEFEKIKEEKQGTEKDREFDARETLIRQMGTEVHVPKVWVRPLLNPIPAHMITRDCQATLPSFEVF